MEAIWTVQTPHLIARGSQEKAIVDECAQAEEAVPIKRVCVMKDGPDKTAENLS